MNKKLIFYQLIIIIFILFLFPAKSAEAANCPVSVAGNYTLTVSCIIPADGNMSVVDGNLTIDSGVTLTIDTNARLTFTLGKSIVINGSISMSAGGIEVVKKSHEVFLNSASGNSCNTVCSNDGKTCVSIGQDSYGTDTYYWTVDGGDNLYDCYYRPLNAESTSTIQCVSFSANCSTVMTDQCGASETSTCCGISLYWTYCLCLE